jgi:hypothetical protein
LLGLDSVAIVVLQASLDHIILSIPEQTMVTAVSAHNNLDSVGLNFLHSSKLSSPTDVHITVKFFKATDLFQILT